MMRDSRPLEYDDGETPVDPIHDAPWALGAAWPHGDLLATVCAGDEMNINMIFFLKKKGGVGKYRSYPSIFGLHRVFFSLKDIFIYERKEI